MYGAIFGFQRCDWWPKCAPASSNWRMVKSGKAMGVVLVRLSLGGSVKAKRASPPERDLEQEPRKIRLWNGAAYRRAGAETQAERPYGRAGSALPAADPRAHSAAREKSLGPPRPLSSYCRKRSSWLARGSIRAG